jgi:hypothetical protein
MSMQIDQDAQELTNSDISVYFHVVDSFDIPRYHYRTVENAFIKYFTNLILEIRNRVR